MVGLVSEPAGPRELDAEDTEPGDDHEKAGAAEYKRRLESVRESGSVRSVANFTASR